MVSERKRVMVEKAIDGIKNHSVIGILDMYKLPARQLYDIRNKMRGKAQILMLKKRLIKLAIEKSGKKGLDKIVEYIGNQPALLLTNTNPFEIARIIDESKSPAAAKPGDVATKDIIIKAGPTQLKPGPVIGELQRAKLPVAIEGEKIVVKEDTLFVKEGEEIDAQKAEILAKLGIEPMEIGLNMLAAYDNGTVYPKDILFVPKEKYIDDLINAHTKAFNLAYNIGYVNKYTIKPLLAKAHADAFNLAMNAGVITKETVPHLLSKAHAQMMALKEKMPDLKTQ